MKMAIKLVPTKCGQEHKESLFPVIPCNHIIAFGLHNQRSRKYFFSIIFLNDDVFSGHLLSAFSVFTHWNEWSLRVKECGCAISVSLLCLQTCIMLHPSPSLCWVRIYTLLQPVQSLGSFGCCSSTMSGSPSSKMGWLYFSTPLKWGWNLDDLLCPMRCQQNWR